MPAHLSSRAGTRRRPGSRAASPRSSLLVLAGTLTGCSSSSSATATTAATASATTCTPRRAVDPGGRHPGSRFDDRLERHLVRRHGHPGPLVPPVDLRALGRVGPASDRSSWDPGWSESGDTDTSDTTGQSLLGADAIRTLFDAGYNVLTWDPRGFGRSGGQAEVDSPAYEARDVATLIDWVATRPGVELDAPGNPRMGMVGGSYGGGIQLVTAATDCRIDAIVPTIAWHSLTTSLFKSGIVKSGWAGILTNLSSSRPRGPGGTGRPAGRPGRRHDLAAQEAWFAARGPAQYLADIHDPHPDPPGHGRHALHPPGGGRQLRGAAGPGRADGDAVVLRWPRRLPDAGRQRRRPRAGHAGVAEAVRAARHLGGHRPGIQLRRPERHQLLGAGLPRGPGRAGHGCRLGHPAAGGDRRVRPRHVAAVRPGARHAGRAHHPGAGHQCRRRPVPFATPVVVVGAPRLRLTYSGTVAAGDRPERVFAQLVDSARVSCSATRSRRSRSCSTAPRTS